MQGNFENDELDKIIREIIGVERRVLFSVGVSTTKRRSDIREIIERRSKEVERNETGTNQTKEL